MKYLLIVLTCLSAITSFAQSAEDRVGVKGPLNFDGKKFNLSWTSHPNADYYIQEYIPAGEKAESFNEMISVFFIKTDRSVVDEMTKKAEEITARKKTDPVANFKTYTNEQTGEAAIDFLVGASEGDKMTIVEFNFYRYKQVQLSLGKGILIFAYSKRSYGDSITNFLKSLSDIRNKYIGLMIEQKLPEIKL